MVIRNVTDFLREQGRRGRRAVCCLGTCSGMVYNVVSPGLPQTSEISTPRNHPQALIKGLILNSRRFPYVFLAAVVLLLYWPATRFQFVNYDDPFFVTGNYHVLTGLSRDSIAYAFTTLMGFYHPITWLSLMLDSYLFGHAPTAFHVTNIWLHVANCLLVFRLMWRMLGSKWVAFAIAVLFAVHPANVESVAWVSERKGLLATLFFLLSALSYLRYFESRRCRFAVFALFLYLLSLLSKPTYMVAFPAILFAFNWLGINQTHANGGLAGRGIFADTAVKDAPLGLRYGFPIVAAILATAAGYITIVAERNMGTLEPITHYSIYDRMVTVPMFYMISLGEVVAPQPISPVHLWSLPGWASLIAAASFLVLLTLFFIKLRHRMPQLLFGWIWFVTMLFPVCGIFKIGDEITDHRYLYLPMVGVFVILSGLAERFTRSAAAQKVAIYATSACAIVCFLYSFAILPIWRDSGSLWTFALRHPNGNWLAANNLAAFYLNANNTDGAEGWLKYAFVLNPQSVPALSNVGQLYALRGQYRKALVMFSEAERIAPLNGDIQSDLGWTLSKLGRDSEALNHYDKSVNLDPANSETLTQYAQLLTADFSSDRPQLLEALQLERDAEKLNSQLNHGTNFDYGVMITMAKTESCLGNSGVAKELASRAYSLAYGRGDSGAAAAAREIIGKTSVKPSDPEPVK